MFKLRHLHQVCFLDYRLHLKKFMALYFCLVHTPLMAQTQITAEQLVNNAYADGVLIATANVCQIEKMQVNQLIFNQKKARSISQNNISYLSPLKIMMTT